MSTRSDRLSAALYFLPIPGLTLRLEPQLRSHLSVARLEGLQYLLALSFGRNDFADDELFERLNTLAQGNFFDYLGVFGALFASGFEPGEANEVLAGELHELMHVADGALVAAQWEVQYALWLLEPDYFQENLHRIIVIWPTANGRFSSYDVLQIALSDLKRFGIEDLDDGILLTHPDMALRAKALAWKLGLTPELHLVDVPFVPNSVQDWVRNSRVWAWYEFKVRVHHILHRWARFLPPKPTRIKTAS